MEPRFRILAARSTLCLWSDTAAGLVQGDEQSAPVFRVAKTKSEEPPQPSATETWGHRIDQEILVEGQKSLS
jgi:hypothetical protein